MSSLGALWVAVWLSHAGGTSAPALPDTLEFAWRAPAECPDEAAVRAGIADSLASVAGPTPLVGAQGIVEATATDTTTHYRLALSITTPDATIERQIRATDCALLARTTALVIRLALDPAAGEEAVTEPLDELADQQIVPTPTPAPSVPPVSAPVDFEASTVDPVTTLADSSDAMASVPSTSPLPPPTPLAVAVRLGTGVGVGVLPRVGVGQMLTVALVGAHWRAEGHGSRWSTRTDAFEQEPTVGAFVSAWSGGARGCWVPGKRVEFPVCAGVELARIDARGFGAPANFETRDIWVAAAIAPGVIWLPEPWLGLFVGTDWFIALRRPGIDGQDRPELHRAGVVALRVSVGLEIRLGRRAALTKKRRVASRWRS